jgi:predicted small integral membrane protein
MSYIQHSKLTSQSDIKPYPDVVAMTRLSKIVLMASVAFYLTLVVFNNIVDYGSNFQFVRNIMLMSSVFEENQGIWRAINSPVLHHICYWFIILWIGVSSLLCWMGAYHCWQVFDANAEQFNQSKSLIIMGLSLILVLWLVVFIAIGGEWFLMWQSEAWNVQNSSFRMFTIIGVLLIYISSPDSDYQKKQ